MEALTGGNASDMPTNSTETCSKGEGFWIYIVTFSIIYAGCFFLSLLAYCLYWLVTKNKSKTSDAGSITSCSRYFLTDRTFRGLMRQLKSGDTIPGKIFIVVTLSCNLAYIALAVYRSLPPRQVEECVTTLYPAIIVESVLVCELLLFALVRFFASKNIVWYWVDFYTAIDILTLFHVFVSIAIGVDWIGLRFLRFAWLIQIITVLQFTRLVRSQTVIDLIQLVISFLVLWLVSSGILHMIEAGGDFWKDESNASTYSVLVYIYLTMVTMSTVGYGDFSPVTDLGRVFMIVFIIGGLAFFAAILPELVEVITRYYANSQFARFDTSRVPRHVIVCGHITAVSAEDFLKDFLHPDRGDKKTHVLFLHPERPDQDLKNVLRAYYTRVQYLLGSVLKAKDLNKARITTSSAVFILTNKNTETPKDEDRANMLRVVSVKNTTDKVPVIIQLVHSFSKSQVTKLEGWSLSRDIAISINELKMVLLAQTCLCPGLSTLIGDLFYTVNVDKFNFSEDEAWRKNYSDGLANELYSGDFSEDFDGMSFHEAAQVCYNKLHLVLLALEHTNSGQHHFYVNPSPKLHPGLVIEHTTMTGYFIAHDQKQLHNVSIYCECCEDNLHTSMKRRPSLKGKLVPNHRKNSQMPHEIENGMSLSVRSVKVDDSGDKSPRHTCVSIQLEDTLNDEEDTAVSQEEPNSDSGTAVSENSSSLEPTDSDNDEEYEDGEDDNELSSYGMSHLHTCDPVRFNDAILNQGCLPVDQQVPPPPNSKIRDHIILCLFAEDSSPLLGLYNFLAPLRAKHLPLDSIRPVVIICNQTFLKKEWSIIRRIPEVYLVVGSPLQWRNLIAARVKHCSVCIVLTVLRTSTGHEHAIDDKEAILCTLSIKKHLKKIEKKVSVITDLRQESNAQFLDFGDEDKPDERIFKSQPYACGETFSVSMFDSVTSSAFHTPGAIYLVDDLICSSATKDCHIIPVPICDTGYTGNMYGEFYNVQLERRNICLGISRQMPQSESHQSYVIVCPDENLTLKETDTAFVLTTMK